MRLALRAADGVRAQQQVSRLGPVACEAGVCFACGLQQHLCMQCTKLRAADKQCMAGSWLATTAKARAVPGLSCAVKEMPHGPSPHGPSARTLNELVLAGKELANKVQAADHDSAVSQYPCCEYRSQARVQRCCKLLQQSFMSAGRLRAAQKLSLRHGAGSYLHALCLQRARAAPERQDGRHRRLVAWAPACEVNASQQGLQDARPDAASAPLWPDLCRKPRHTWRRIWLY